MHEPQRIDLDRFAGTRREYLIAVLRIHPSQLCACLTGVQQPVVGIDMDAVAGAIDVCMDDGNQCGEKIAEQLRIPVRLQIVIQRMKHPQGRVGRVVFGIFAAVGESVRQHAAVNERGKGAQNVGSDVVASQSRCESRQGNHGVASPVGEPRVPGDDGGARGNRVAAANDKLVGSPRQCAWTQGGALLGKRMLRLWASHRPESISKHPSLSRPATWPRRWR